MSDRITRGSRRGLILALPASGTVAGFVARGYAMAMPKMRAGVPASLTPAGEISFFLLGALLALGVTLLVGVSPVGGETIEKRSGFTGLVCGLGIGFIFGLINEDIKTARSGHAIRRHGEFRWELGSRFESSSRIRGGFGCL
jgi:hypothetical protein